MKVYGDWDSVLYELRLMTKAISATPRFCEMYHIWGSQDSGKDTMVKMLHAFLGHGKDNYGVQLPGNYVVQQTRYLTAKDGPAPYHARTLGSGWPGPVKSPSTTGWRMTSSSPFVTWKVRQSAAGSLTRVPGLQAYGFAGGNKQSPSPCDSTGWDAAAASSLPDNGQLHLEAVHGHRGASRGWPQDPDKPRRVQQVHLLPCGKSRRLVRWSTTQAPRSSRSHR